MHGKRVTFIYRISMGSLKEKNSLYVFGIHPVAEAISAGKDISKVYIKKDRQIGLLAEVFQKIRESGIPYQFVPAEKLNGMVRGRHQGIIAVLSLVEYKNLEEIVQRTFEEGRNPFLLILDQITDVRNFGAIARTAECAGVDAIIIPGKNSVTVTPDAIKTSAGALNRIAVSCSKDLVATVKYLQNSGIEIVAAIEKTDDFYFNASLNGPIAIILGSEELGISSSLISIADKRIKIPLAGFIDSLNVSVACGIIVYEVVRQRNQTE
jgi:23S rRNA (guanosine2251-2'-O)-methyltransferase